MKLYVAYGSNLDTVQMAYRCPDAQIYGTGKLIGWEMLFRGSKTGSYATIQRRVGSYIPVLVWSVSERDERNLDRYEGFPRFYYKQNVMVTMDNTGRKKLCMVYIMDRSRLPGIPTRTYTETIRRGYVEFGFDQDILDDAIEDNRNEVYGRIKNFS